MAASGADNAKPPCSAGVKFQQAWRILSLVQIRMSSLQKLAQEHTLPALSLTPLASETLPRELRDRQTAVPGVESNEGLFRMFSESMETRQNVRTSCLIFNPTRGSQWSCAVRHRAVLGQQERSRHGAGASVRQADRARVPQDPAAGRLAADRRAGAAHLARAALARDADAAPLADADAPLGRADDEWHVLVAEHAAVRTADGLAVVLVRLACGGTGPRAFDARARQRGWELWRADDAVQSGDEPARSDVLGADERCSAACLHISGGLGGADASAGGTSAAAATAAAATAAAATAAANAGAGVVPVRRDRRHGLFRAAAAARTGAVCADHERCLTALRPEAEGAT